MAPEAGVRAFEGLKPGKIAGGNAEFGGVEIEIPPAPALAIGRIGQDCGQGFRRGGPEDVRMENDSVARGNGDVLLENNVARQRVRALGVDRAFVQRDGLALDLWNGRLRLRKGARRMKQDVETK